MDTAFSDNSVATIAEKMAASGAEWAEKEHGASLLEESRKSVRAQIALEYLGEAGSVAKAELHAEADQKYKDHLKAMVNARKAANIARVNYDACRTWIDMIRSKEATDRALITLR